MGVIFEFGITVRIAAAYRTGRSAPWLKPPTAAEAPKFDAELYHHQLRLGAVRSAWTATLRPRCCHCGGREGPAPLFSEIGQGVDLLNSFGCVYAGRVQA